LKAITRKQHTKAHLFCSCDNDLDVSNGLDAQNDLDILKTYLHTQNELSTSSLSTARASQTDRWWVKTLPHWCRKFSFIQHNKIKLNKLARVLLKLFTWKQIEKPVIHQVKASNMTAFQINTKVQRQW